MQEQAPKLVDAALEGELLKGCYKIDERVGSGGMAWVYKATHTMLLETVAVKVLFAQHASDDNLCERFLREARLQAKVKHPHVVQITDFIEERGVVGLVQEWIGGGDLQDWAEVQGLPLPMPTMMALMLPVIEAVAHAHSKGVVHRDLKPANVMLVPQNTGLPLPKLTDFGLARQQETEGPTKTNSSMGTPLYMAPEQFIDAKQVDERADIYSLGVMLYQLSSGQLPFVGDLNSLMYQVFQGERLPPPNVHPAISDVILRCIDKSPDARFASCEALAEALTQAFEELPTTSHGMAHPPSSLPTIDHDVPSWDALPSASQIPAVTSPAPPQHRPNPQHPAEAAPPTRPMRDTDEADRREQEARRHQETALYPPPPHSSMARLPFKNHPFSHLYPLATLVVLLLCVGFAAYWWSSKINQTVTISTSKQTPPISRQVDPLAAPTPIRPLPPPTPPKSTTPSTSARSPTTPTASHPAYVIAPAAHKLLDKVTRTYGGRAAFAKLKTLYFEGIRSDYKRDGVEIYPLVYFAILPGYQRIDRTDKLTRRIITPTTAYTIRSGQKKLLPKQSQRDLQILYRLQTIEFADPKDLIGIQLLSPFWHEGRPAHQLQLTHKDGYQVILLITKDKHRIVRRKCKLLSVGSPRYAWYYGKLRKVPLTGTTHTFLWPRHTELYKNGRKLEELKILNIKLNAPRVRASLFR